MTYDALLQLAEERHSTRRFSPRVVERELLEKIIAVAKTSPYASGRTNWGIRIVDDPTVIEEAVNDVETILAELNARMHPPVREEFLKYSQNFTAFRSAPALLVPYFRIAPGFSLMLKSCPRDLELFDRDNMVKSISCVAMLITLAAESLALGSCYITGALLAEPALTKRFAIPNGRHIGAIMPIGYKDE